jgi:hypothetical protein
LPSFSLVKSSKKSGCVSGVSTTMMPNEPSLFSRGGMKLPWPEAALQALQDVAGEGGCCFSGDLNSTISCVIKKGYWP